MCHSSRDFECEKCQVFLAVVCALAISTVIVQFADFTRGVVASVIGISFAVSSGVVLWIAYSGKAWKARRDRAQALLLVIALCVTCLAIFGSNLEDLQAVHSGGNFSAILATTSYFVSALASLAIGGLAVNLLAGMFPNPELSPNNSFKPTPLRGAA